VDFEEAAVFSVASIQDFAVRKTPIPYGLVFSLVAWLASQALAQTDPLPAWNNGPAKTAIVEFIAKVTKAGGPGFVPPAARIATFANDGTLWAEQPMYFQLVFALDRVNALAPQHPEWKDKEPFASLLKERGSRRSSCLAPSRPLGFSETSTPRSPLRSFPVACSS
jgi:hypothetical protein